MPSRCTLPAALPSPFPASTQRRQSAPSAKNSGGPDPSCRGVPGAELGGSLLTPLVWVIQIVALSAETAASSKPLLHEGLGKVPGAQWLCKPDGGVSSAGVHSFIGSGMADEEAASLLVDRLPETRKFRVRRWFGVYWGDLRWLMTRAEVGSGGRYGLRGQVGGGWMVCRWRLWSAGEGADGVALRI